MYYKVYLLTDRKDFKIFEYEKDAYEYICKRLDMDNKLCFGLEDIDDNDVIVKLDNMGKIDTFSK